MDPAEICGQLAAALIRVRAAQGPEAAARMARACARAVDDLARDFEKQADKP